MALYSGFSHEKWWFSIAMLVYQRVMGFLGGKYLETYGQCVRLLPYEKRIQLYML